VSETESVPGFYGKLPHLGDFVSRRLARPFIESWDRWLQSSIAASREQLGEDWLGKYLISPIWRFALTRGVCGDKAMAGVLMPSVDRVGRYFPLTIAAPVEPRALPYLFLYQSSWFEKLEGLALSGLEDGFDFERFDSDLAAIPFPPELAGGIVRESDGSETDSPSRQAYHWSLHDLTQMNLVYADFSRVLLEKSATAYSYWGTAGSELLGASFFVCEGLPPVDAFTALLMGNWSQRSWNIRSYAVAHQLGDETMPGISQGGDPSASMDQSDGGVWDSAGISVVGCRRKINEDAMLDRGDAGMWVVADGMGGHKAGEVASQAIIGALAAVPPAETVELFADSVRSVLASVNERLWRIADASDGGEIIGSTVVALLAKEDQCRYLWAGDSRLYRYRLRKLEQVTRDHNYVGDAVQYGVAALEVEPVRTNVITRAVGADGVLNLDSGALIAQPDDIFILCSDGLDKELTHAEIEGICGMNHPVEIARELIARAEAKGARDNVTVVVARFRSNESCDSPGL
jgi:type VI secretion system protein ImpM